MVKLAWGLPAGLAIILAGCGDGQRHYSGGHPIAHTFEVFSYEDPLGEVRGIFLYMILPVAIGTLMSFSASYLRGKKSESKTKQPSLLARSVLCGIILASFGYICALGFHPYRYLSFPRFLADAFFGAILFGPALLIVGPVLLLERFTRHDPTRRMPDLSLYLISVAALVAEYFWLSAFNQA